MEWPTVTKVFLLCVTLLVILYDVVAIWFGGRDASVSVVVKDFIFANPIVAVAVGILIGHLLWPT